MKKTCKSMNDKISIFEKGFTGSNKSYSPGIGLYLAKKMLIV